jgi:tRNA A-37 threonylcarbamoyl transferase component Bud32
MDLEPGRTIGPYRLIRKLGEGTTSRVFEVEHIAIRRRAAMKIAHTDATLPGIGKRLFAEAQAVNLINHPNIVAITEIIEPSQENHAFALVMELLEGQLLADVVAADGRLAPERFLPILAQVCDGLAAVHAAGFVHRDLKPENICLIERDGRRDVVKLLDFGLVKALRADIALPTATREGTFMGSPAYTSPEQAQGQTVDHRTDIYAIGIMLHELVTGQLPFQAEGIADLLMKQITVTAPRLPAEMLATDMGLALDAIIQTCLAKDPAQRSLTAPQLADMFRRLAGGERIAPRQIRGRRRTGRAAGGRRQLMTFAPLAALAVAAVALILSGTRFGAGASARLPAAPAFPAALVPHEAQAATGAAREGSGGTQVGVGVAATTPADESVARSSRPAPAGRRWTRPPRDAGSINKARTLDPYR